MHLKPYRDIGICTSCSWNLCPCSGSKVSVPFDTLRTFDTFKTPSILIQFDFTCHSYSFDRNPFLTNSFWFCIFFFRYMSTFDVIWIWYVNKKYFSSNLTWRDMQHIVVMTAHTANLHARDWKTNGVGRNVSHSFGYGMFFSFSLYFFSFFPPLFLSLFYSPFSFLRLDNFDSFYH